MSEGQAGRVAVCGLFLCSPETAPSARKGCVRPSPVKVVRHCAVMCGRRCANNNVLGKRRHAGLILTTGAWVAAPPPLPRVSKWAQQTSTATERAERLNRVRMQQADWLRRSECQLDDEDND